MHVGRVVPAVRIAAVRHLDDVADIDQLEVCRAVGGEQLAHPGVVADAVLDDDVGVRDVARVGRARVVVVRVGVGIRDDALDVDLACRRAELAIEPQKFSAATTCSGTASAIRSVHRRRAARAQRREQRRPTNVTLAALRGVDVRAVGRHIAVTMTTPSPRSGLSGTVAGTLSGMVTVSKWAFGAVRASARFGVAMTTTSSGRSTRQKRALAVVIDDAQEFRSAQELHEALRGRGEHVGLTTVYNQLRVACRRRSRRHDAVARRRDPLPPVWQCRPPPPLAVPGMRPDRRGRGYCGRALGREGRRRSRLRRRFPHDRGRGYLLGLRSLGLTAALLPVVVLSTRRVAGAHVLVGRR